MTAGRQTAIGAFVLGGFLLGLGAILFFGNFRIFSATTRAGIVFQDSISGLSVGAPVTFRGVRVGAVDSISLKFDARTHTAYIPVIVSLEPDRVQLTQDSSGSSFNLDTLIARGLRAEVNTQSFVTGQAEISLDMDPASPAVLHPRIIDLPEIPAQQSAIQRVREQLSELPLHELVDNAGATLQSLRTLSEQLNTRLPALVDSLKSSSDRAGDLIDVTTKAVPDLQARLETALAHADQSMAHLDQLVINTDREVAQRGTDVHTLLTASNQTVAEAHELLSNLNEITSRRGAARANLDSTLRDLAAATASLRGFAGDIERNPQLLLTGRRP